MNNLLLITLYIFFSRLHYEIGSVSYRKRNLKTSPQDTASADKWLKFIPDVCLSGKAASIPSRMHQRPQPSPNHVVFLRLQNWIQITSRSNPREHITPHNSALPAQQ